MDDVFGRHLVQGRQKMSSSWGETVRNRIWRSRPLRARAPVSRSSRRPTQPSLRRISSLSWRGASRRSVAQRHPHSLAPTRTHLLPTLNQMATENIIHDDSSDEDEASTVPEGQVYPFSSLPPLPPLPPYPQRAERTQHDGPDAAVGYCTPSVGRERIIKDASSSSPPSSPCPTTPGHPSLKRPSSRTGRGDEQSSSIPSKRARVELAGLGARGEME